MPTALRREIRQVMHQQCWCWGCDIRYPRGNLLMRYGAARVRPFEPRPTRSTAYHIELDRAWLVLWGFGLAIVPDRGVSVLIPRYEPSPRAIQDTAALRSVWCQSELPPHDAANTASAWWSTLQAFKWIASYESWIADHAGVRWRLQCTQQFEASVVPGDRLTAAWDGINERLERVILRPATAGEANCQVPGNTSDLCTPTPARKPSATA